MIIHETSGVTKPVVAFIDEGKDFEKCHESSVFKMSRSSSILYGFLRNAENP